MAPARLDLDDHGAALYRGAALAVSGAIETALAKVDQRRAGVRITENADLAQLLYTRGAIGRLAATVLGSECKPVRTILFDKSPQTNWTLGWHQDRTIAVRARCDISGFGPWTTKQGLLHVEPPFSVIETMVTLRVHLDDVPPDNAPLLIAPGSHRRGRVAEPDIDSAVSRCGIATCIASRGDVWLYRTPIIHASEASRSANRRRVLQIDYSSATLPGALEWLGI